MTAPDQTETQPGALRADPSDLHAEDFPYDEIDARLNADARAAAKQVDDAEVERRARELASQVIGEYIAWLLRRDQATQAKLYDVRRIGKRVLASGWIIRPDLFDGMSLRELAEFPSVSAKKTQLSFYALEFSDRFGIRGRGQKSERARETYREIHKQRPVVDPSRN